MFDNEANVFHGKVINLHHVITFEGESVDELRKAFHNSAVDYLEFCVKRGKEPEKPYSGKFLVRVVPEHHKTIALQARKSGKNHSTWVQGALMKSVDISKVELR